MNRNWNKDWRKSIIVMSGGFDPIHKGHLRMFREASWLGHHVVIGLNSDEWLIRKKGKPFMEFEERKEIIEGFKYVNQVIPFDDSDDTARSLIHQVRATYNGGMFNHDWEGNNPTGRKDYEIYFANGGDQNNDSIPEVSICKKLGIGLIENLGDKIQSSSWLLKESDE